MLTLNDVAERLKQIDEISLLEILEITAEDIVEKFKEKIEDKYEYLVEELTDLDDHSYDEENEWWEYESK